MEVDSNNVISLEEWKKRKETDGIDDLIAQVSELMDAYRYGESLYGAPVFPPENTFNSEYYNDEGISNYADIVLEPDVDSCCRTLAWVSYILTSIGYTDESNKIDDIITILECREQ